MLIGCCKIWMETRIERHGARAAILVALIYPETPGTQSIGEIDAEIVWILLVRGRAALQMDRYGSLLRTCLDLFDRPGKVACESMLLHRIGAAVYFVLVIHERSADRKEYRVTAPDVLALVI